MEQRRIDGIALATPAADRTTASTGAAAGGVNWEARYALAGTFASRANPGIIFQVYRRRDLPSR